MLVYVAIGIGFLVLTGLVSLSVKDEDPDMPWNKVLFLLGWLGGWSFIAAICCIFFVEGWTATIILAVLGIAFWVGKPFVEASRDKEDQYARDAANPNLTNCPHCRNRVSVAAAACPSCGAPLS
jgi:hypothetical protein